MLGLNENQEFVGFAPEDFDAFTREKWNSNMFTLPRRRVKAKLSHLGIAAEAKLAEVGLPLVMHLSDEFPSLWNNKIVDSLWLFFSRDEAAQAALTAVIDKERTLAATLADPTPRYRQVFIGVAVTESHLEIGLRMHYDAWVDRDNLARKLERAEDVDALSGLLRELPDFYEVGLVGGELHSPVALAGGELATICERLVAERGWLFVGARLPRDQVTVVGAEIRDTVVDAMHRLASVYKFIAWSPANDAISLERIAAEHEQVLRATHEQWDRERAERVAGLAAKELEAQKLRSEIEDRVREQEAWRSREIAARRVAAARAAEEEKRLEARARAEALAANWGRPPSQPSPVVSTPVEPAPTTAVAPVVARPPAPESVELGIRVGDHVEVSRGFLTGRRGVVQELDDKGGARINFGAMSSRLPLEDVRRARRSEGERPKNENEAAPEPNHGRFGQQKRDAGHTDRGARDGHDAAPRRPRGSGFSEG